MIKKIALIPLDDRPCSLDLPKKLAGISGCEVVAPPKEFLGNFLEPGKPSSVIRWLKDTAGQAEALIVSAEMLCFGGLVASRNFVAAPGASSENLKVLEEIKKDHPGLKIFLFSVIMRLTVSVTKENERFWKDIFEYSKLVDVLETTSDQKYAKKIEEMKSRIPDDLLREYLDVRQRNHAVNLLAVELAGKGAVDYLVLGLEDAAKFGLHRREIRALDQRASSVSAKEKVSIICGTDEIASALISRAVSASAGLCPKVYVEFSSEDAKYAVPLYEDRPLFQTASEHIEVSGGQMSGNIDGADLILYVNAAKQGQTDLFLEGVKGESADQDEDGKKSAFALKRLIASGLPAALADVSYANGADPDLMKALFGNIEVSHLAAFAAWNTASNSIGCALSQVMVLFCSLKQRVPGAKEANLELLFERFADDYLYQSLVRTALKKNIEQKTSVFDLGGYRSEIEWVVKQQMDAAAKDMFDKYFRPAVAGRALKFDSSLPWPRLFEIKIDAKFT